MSCYTQNENLFSAGCVCEESRLCSGESIICPSAVSVGAVSVSVVLNNISALRLDEKPPSGELTFDVGVRIEEKQKKSDRVIVVFVLTIKTRPSFAKFGVEGLATLVGKEEEIEKLLEIDPNAKVPRVLDAVYQHVFMAVYLLSTVLETPHPPPDLFSSSRQALPKVEILTDSAAETSKDQGVTIQPAIGAAEEDEEVKQ
jgi:hypothetical protein